LCNVLLSHLLFSSPEREGKEMSAVFSISLAHVWAAVLALFTRFSCGTLLLPAALFRKPILATSAGTGLMLDWDRDRTAGSHNHCPRCWNRREADSFVRFPDFRHQLHAGSQLSRVTIVTHKKTMFPFNSPTDSNPGPRPGISNACAYWRSARGSGHMVNRFVVCVT
jgi:hypothetical protein